MSHRSSKRHSVSVIGLGAMGRRHVRVLTGLPARFDLVGAFDVDGDAARASELPSALRRFESACEAIDGSDVVIVATPIATHHAIVLDALRAGRHVFVEKPLCASSDEAQALAGIAAGAGRLFVGHSERFNPVVRVLARLVGAARGDEPLTFDLRRRGPCAPSAYGVLLNLGVHDLDLASYLGGDALQLHGAVGAPGGRDAIEDAAHVVFSIAGGAIGHVHVDRTVPVKRRTLEVTTQRWLYEGDLLAHRLVRTARGTRSRSEVPLPLDEPLVAQAIALADALDGATAKEIATGQDGARAVAWAERAAAMCRAADPIELRSEVRRTPG